MPYRGEGHNRQYRISWIVAPSVCVGDTPERCHALVTGVNSPHLRLIWDPANFVQVGVADLADKYWSLLGPFVDYIHVKDAKLADGMTIAVNALRKVMAETGVTEAS